MSIISQLPIQLSLFFFVRNPKRQLQEYDPTEFKQSMLRPHEPTTAHSSISALQKKLEIRIRNNQPWMTKDVNFIS